MLNDKNKKLIKIVVTCLVIGLIIWFLILSPLLKFKNEEKTVLEAAKRYFEINTSQLPTGKRIKTITLQTLYDKELIKTDLLVPNSSKVCTSKDSFVKVKRVGAEYQYYVYLQCGVFKSNIDHEGPVITLKGDEEITINKGDKYSDAGIEKVVDNTDGKMNAKDVVVDTSKVNTNKIGTYEITYKIKDSFENETIKTRTIKVEQILDKIVKKAIGKTNMYKGNNSNNYVKIDGIVFKIVGLNDDESVKVVSANNLAQVDYNSVDKWLEDFYDKLSDSAKTNIKVDSKWCNDNVTDLNKFTKCSNYSKKKTVGLLSVADINNSKSDDGTSNLTQWQYNWLSNTSNNKAIKYGSNNANYKKESKTSLSGIRPALNIKNNTKIISGNGTDASPYILKGNKKELKAGTKISESRIGDYITYSGYTWRIAEIGTDSIVKVVMNDTVLENNAEFMIDYGNKAEYYNINSKNNLAYKIVNNINKYVNTKLFVKSKISVYQFKNQPVYDKKVTSKTYSTKLYEVSMFDLFSTSETTNHWYRESNANGYAFANNSLEDTATYKIIEGNSNQLKLTANLDKNVSIKSGKGTTTSPYAITK